MFSFITSRISNPPLWGLLLQYWPLSGLLSCIYYTIFPSQKSCKAQDTESRAHITTTAEKDLVIAAPPAVQISPHFYFPPIKSTAVSIEYLGAEYVLPWQDTSRNPKLEKFNDIINDAISVQHSPEEDEIWQKSTFVNYGVYAQIRQLENETNFPVIKMVSRHADARKHIQNEFRVLKMLSEITAVVEIQGVPLVDSQGIFGFRMEKLDDIPIEDRLEYICQIKDAVEHVHKTGFVHCDLTFSNIMLKDQRVKLIDFGLSGAIGETIPEDHLLRRFFGFDAFSNSIDDEKLDRLIQIAAQA